MQILIVADASISTMIPTANAMHIIVGSFEEAFIQQTQQTEVLIGLVARELEECVIDILLAVASSAMYVKALCANIHKGFKWNGIEFLRKSLHPT